MRSYRVSRTIPANNNITYVSAILGYVVIFGNGWCSVIFGKILVKLYAVFRFLRLHHMTIWSSFKSVGVQYLNG